MHNRMRIACAALAAFMAWIPSASAQATIDIEDFLVMPMTGVVDGQGSNELLLARVNTLREEVGGAKRLFITDLNGSLYILDKDTKKLTTYLDFNGIGDKPGIFHRITVENGFANGLINFQFDPDYAHNGKFYTIHLEDPAVNASAAPGNKSCPGLKSTFSGVGNVWPPG